MKKFFLFALAAAFAFTSCTKDETLATAQPGAIDFAVAANNATRSNYDPSITTENIQDFAVYGWMQAQSINSDTTIGGDVFNNEVVYGGNGNWTYDNTQYWAKNVYYLSALAPAFKENPALRNWTIEKTGHNKLGIGKVIFENKDGEQDLIYWADILDNTQGAVEDRKVQVVFNHLLSKVKFSFENAFNNELTTIRVDSVRIENAYIKGSIDLNTEDWWSDPAMWMCEGTKTFEFGNVTNTLNGASEDIAVGKQMESDKEVLLFPAAEKTYVIKFHVTVLNGEAIAGKYSHEVELTTTFKMGYSYDLKATLTAANVNPKEELKPIEFEVTVKEWMQEGTGGENNDEVLLNSVVKNPTELKAAIASNVSEIILGEDIDLGSETLTINRELTLNLGGRTLTTSATRGETGNTYSYPLLVTKGGKLTIDGPGKVKASAANYSIAIWAYDGGEVIINGGEYFNTSVDGEEGADLIYVSAGGKVTINGGKFKACENKKLDNTGTKEPYSTINLQDNSGSSAVVKGGEFYKFNPADNVSENPQVSFVAEGYKVEQNGDWFKVVKQ